MFHAYFAAFSIQIRFIKLILTPDEQKFNDTLNGTDSIEPFCLFKPQNQQVRDLLIQVIHLCLNRFIFVFYCKFSMI